MKGQCAPAVRVGPVQLMKGQCALAVRVGPVLSEWGRCSQSRSCAVRVGPMLSEQGQRSQGKTCAVRVGRPPHLPSRVVCRQCTPAIRVGHSSRPQFTSSLHSPYFSTAFCLVCTARSCRRGKRCLTMCWCPWWCWAWWSPRIILLLSRWFFFWLSKLELPTPCKSSPGPFKEMQTSAKDDASCYSNCDF
eukprot:1152526-Pelagomonas_calceolata.AAC.1